MSAHHLLPRFNAWTLTYILLIPGIITLGANHDHTDSQGYSSYKKIGTDGVKVISGSVCKVRTQDTDNFDEEVKPLASAR